MTANPKMHYTADAFTSSACNSSTNPEYWTSAPDKVTCARCQATDVFKTVVSALSSDFEAVTYATKSVPSVGVEKPVVYTANELLGKEPPVKYTVIVNGLDLTEMLEVRDLFRERGYSVEVRHG